jgi:superfamily II DNA helicase RecQ
MESAFGMGIDKPDIRTIVNYGPTKNVEAYFQQSGRCARDGLPGKCVSLLPTLYTTFIVIDDVLH